jgi:hypothetical protein
VKTISAGASVGRYSADERINPPHFEAREQANHRHEREHDQEPAICRRARVDRLRVAAHAEPPALGEQIRRRLPDAEQAAEHRAERAHEEQPFTGGAELLAESVGQHDEHRRALAFELHGLPDDDHENAEQRHHEIARREIDAARAEIVGVGAPFLAQPIAVRKHRQRAADAPYQRDGPDDGLGIRPRQGRHEQTAQHLAAAGPERDSRQRDRHEHDADADLHREVEPAIAAAQHERESHEARQHAERDLAVRRVVEHRNDRVQRNAVRAHLRRADEERPQ